MDQNKLGELLKPAIDYVLELSEDMTYINIDLTVDNVDVDLTLKPVAGRHVRMGKLRSMD